MTFGAEPEGPKALPIPKSSHDTRHRRRFATSQATNNGKTEKAQLSLGFWRTREDHETPFGRPETVS